MPSYGILFQNGGVARVALVFRFVVQFRVTHAQTNWPMDKLSVHRISGPLSFVFPVTAAHAH